MISPSYNAEQVSMEDEFGEKVPPVQVDYYTSAAVCGIKKTRKPPKVDKIYSVTADSEIAINGGPSFIWVSTENFTFMLTNTSAPVKIPSSHVKIKDTPFHCDRVYSVPPGLALKNHIKNYFCSKILLQKRMITFNSIFPFLLLYFLFNQILFFSVLFFIERMVLHWIALKLQ